MTGPAEERLDADQIAVGPLRPLLSFLLPMAGGRVDEGPSTNRSHRTLGPALASLFWPLQNCLTACCMHGGQRATAQITLLSSYVRSRAYCSSSVFCFPREYELDKREHRRNSVDGILSRRDLFASTLATPSRLFQGWSGYEACLPRSSLHECGEKYIIQVHGAQNAAPSISACLLSCFNCHLIQRTSCR